MTKAVFAGSFDPPTYGHLNVIERASKLFDKLDIVIAVNPDKNYMFDSQERVEMISKMTEGLKNISIHTWNGLIVDYCKNNEVDVLVRGIRNANDFAYEFDLSLMNKSLGNVETLMLPTEQKYVIVRSSSIKELAKFGGDITGMVPEFIAEKVKNFFK